MKIESVNFNEIISEKSFLSLLSNKDKKLSPFIQDFSSIESLKTQMELKSNSYGIETRKVLCQALIEQGNADSLVNRLKSEDSFTITTGHQLNLFTGPLYSIYKIASVIKIAEEAQKQYPNKDFVPVFWMATEDHDFDEINHLNLFGKKFSWETKKTGAVGKFKIENIEAFKSSVLSMFREPSELILSILNCYQEGTDLAASHRELVKLLFQNQELIIIDGDDHSLKSLFAPKMLQELSKTTFEAVKGTNELLIESDLKEQAHAREINLFYLDQGVRERIILTIDGYSTSKGYKSWTKNEIETEIKTSPERFSPNVLFRPIYQETILPNLMYVGGGGELAYWMQLKESFKAFQTPMPLVQVRFSAAILQTKQKVKWEGFGFTLSDLFISLIELEKRYVANNTDEFTLTQELQEMRTIFEGIKNRSKTIDKTLERTVLSEEQKMNNSMQYLESKVNKAKKQKFDVELKQIGKQKNQLFPNDSWQERQDNILSIISRNDSFITELIDVIEPLSNQFNFVLLD